MVSSKSGPPAGTPSAQNDPSELLEVFDASGRPTGRARSRAEIHLDGDWHLAFHCWVLRKGGQEVVLQRRSALKDTFPLCWDAAAAGHWRFGESAREAAREIAEELGLAVGFEQLRRVGREHEERAFASGLIDRELHEVYALEWEAPLSSYRPDPREVSALAAVSARDLLELVSGERDWLRAVEPSRVVLRRQDLVPYSPARLRRLLAWNLHPTGIVGNNESHH
jgi:isopentenyldiphosphate isomerase